MLIAMAAATAMAISIPLFERTFRMLHHPEGQDYPGERTPTYYVVVIVLSRAVVTRLTCLLISVALALLSGNLDTWFLDYIV
jgi:hypothetical protein